MRRSQIETKYLKTKTQTDLKLHKKHKKFVLSFTKGKEENILVPRYEKRFGQYRNLENEAFPV